MKESDVQREHQIGEQFARNLQDARHGNRHIGSSSLETQVGGEYYKNCAIQPVQFMEANGLKFLEGCVIKRLVRHDKPTGKGEQDIRKAIHELQLLLELRYGVKP